MEYLIRTVRGALRGDPHADRVRRVRQAIENCRNTVRGIISEPEPEEQK